MRARKRATILCLAAAAVPAAADDGVLRSLRMREPRPVQARWNAIPPGQRVAQLPSARSQGDPPDDPAPTPAADPLSPPPSSPSPPSSPAPPSSPPPPSSPRPPTSPSPPAPAEPSPASGPPSPSSSQDKQSSDGATLG